MRFITEGENLKVSERAGGIFNIADLKGTCADTIYTVNYFKKPFGGIYFMMANNVFESETDYGRLTKFLKNIDERLFYVQSVFNGEYRFKTIEAHAGDEYKSYAKYINSEWVDGTFDFERQELGGIPLLGDYVLMFGTNDNWAMVHDRYNDVITIAIDSSLELDLYNVFMGKLYDVNTMIDWLGKLAGGGLIEELQIKLRTWYPKGRLQLAPFKFKPWD